MIEKGPKGRFFAPDKLDNPGTSEGKGKKEKKERGETNWRRRKKSNGCTLSFYNGYSWIFSADPNLEIRGGQSSRPFKKSGGEGGA